MYINVIPGSEWKWVGGIDNRDYGDYAGNLNIPRDLGSANDAGEWVCD